ncbi:hypothetical protein OTU49_005609 [Cherax quadricarinatus]|uniref:Fucosyltransferase n=1 Tax=Cherax quadricarinatus TaxID=27406 RepID=A0AAW0YKS4_CHEQU
MLTWRMMRVLKLLWLLMFLACALAAFNLLFASSHDSHLHDHLGRETLDSRESQQVLSPEERLLEIQNWVLAGHQKGVLPQVLSVNEQLTPAAPVVKKELSFGVHEEENSAREVLDMEAAEKDNKRGHFLDANAANEVNSVEPETNVNNRNPAVAVSLRQNFKDYNKLSLPSGHNWRNLSEYDIKKLSVLGRRLYLNEEIGTVKDRTFTILVWKTGPQIEKRLLKEYGKLNKDPFRKCSAQNCKLTYEDEAARTADAILIHLHRIKGPNTFPNRTKINQRWIWLTDESPYNTFMVAKVKDMAKYNGYFNWSMSYRMDSDIPVPYGRTVEMKPEEAASYHYIDYFKLKPKTVAILGSNCGSQNKRWDYVRELKKYIEIDEYGGCGTLKCPGHFMKDCLPLRDYKFYLSFENGDCREYLTEKVWWNALGKGAVPVVMGAIIDDYMKFLPPKSFIHINDFASPQHLAKYLMYLASNPVAYNRYHAWRSRYRVLNEHGYFASEVFHYCRICEALNYNDPAPKVYNNMEVFWNKKTQCFPPTWEDRLKSLAVTKS